VSYRLLIPASVMLTPLLIAGVAFAATRHCNGGKCRGTDGADKMVGTARDDALCGEQGNDRISGRAGEDILVGGSDDDKINGDDGGDKIKGGPGKDVIRAGSGDDVVRAGRFNQENDRARDFVACGSGVDTVYVTGLDVVRADCEIRK
jgi:Ca2+-binding RTX toxin-like protein